MQFEAHRQDDFTRRIGWQRVQFSYRLQRSLIEYREVTRLLHTRSADLALGVQQDQDEHFALLAAGDRLGRIKLAISLLLDELLPNDLLPSTTRFCGFLRVDRFRLL